MLNIVTWFWGTKYSPKYVERLARGLRRGLMQSHRLVVMTDGRQVLSGYECHDINEQDLPLLNVRGCFARLRMFDPDWQKKLSMQGERIVCVDLDTVITGNLDPLFDRVEPLVILQGANSANPCPYTACLFMLQAGAHPELWQQFSLEAAEKIPKYEFADDQGWMHYLVPGAAAWNTGAESGVWSFRKRGWPSDDVLPSAARMVAFPGGRDPSQFVKLPWVRDHWVM